MSLRHVSPGYRLAGVGLVAILTLVGVDWNRAQARSTAAHDKGAAHEAHKSGKGGRHGPNQVGVPNATRQR